MRLGVSHVHHPGNELTLASLRAVYHSAAAPHTHRHSPCLKTNIPLISPINQSIKQSRSPDIRYLHAFLAFISWSNDRNMFPRFTTFFFFNRSTKVMSNFSILNHTCKVASNFMPCCLFLRHISRRVNLINRQKYICSHVLLTTNKKPINQLSDLAVFMQTEKSLKGNIYYLILFKH